MSEQQKVTFRYAVREDAALILRLIKKLAEYEKIPESVYATEEFLEEWMFDKQRAEVIFAQIDGKEIGFVFFFKILVVRKKS